MPVPDGPDYATIAERIGLTALRSLYPALTGSGITVGQVEASSSGTQGGIDFEPDPDALGHSATNADHFFTYFRNAARSFTYNDGVLGAASTHATVQAGFFYGATVENAAPTGVAPGVAHVNVYEALSYLTRLAAAPLDAVVNLSVTFSGVADIDAAFDAAANRTNAVFVAAAGNGGTPASPSSAYNVISVDTWPVIQAVGPADNGVTKPDIVAPQTLTSRTTAIVSGTATLLVQAGLEGLGGAGTQTDATRFTTIKALLLNGAVKPADYYTTPYAPTAEQPLNAAYGAGIVNILNSVQTLAAGEVSPGGSGALQGWDHASLAALDGTDATTRYGVDLLAGIGFTATLTWAADDANTIHHMALRLYDQATGALLASSDAWSSNVQQFLFTSPGSGAAELEVLLHGEAAAITQDYALAFATGAAVACFGPGTRLLGERGEIPIESLRAGDRLVTLEGRFAPVRFVGRRRVDSHVAPIRICRDAFAAGVPHRDLLLSPDHGVVMRDGASPALVNVRLLANGRSIVVRPLPGITYWHIALDRHAIILADGLPVESYLDTGNRGDFDNAAEALAMLPTRACAPLLSEGPRIAALRIRLAARAGKLCDDPDPLLATPQGWFAPCRRARGYAAFAAPGGPARLISRLQPDLPSEGRRLGLPLTRLTFRGQTIVPVAGLHAAETGGGHHWQWTNGAATLALPEDQPGLLELWWEPSWARWWAPARNAI